MFPGVDGFTWDVGHIVFLGAFFTVVALLLGATAWAAATAVLDVRARRVPALRWHAAFADLPAATRACRHAITGDARRRVCTRGFACGECPDHEALALRSARRSVPFAAPAGLQTPRDCLFHRGHAWARREADGSMTIGLDDLADRVLGPVDEVRLPRSGERLAANGVAWTARVGRDEVRVLAPVAGEVVGCGGRAEGWYLKLRPSAGGPDTRHLLSGDEASAWMGHELQRLVVAMQDPAVGAALADGGRLGRDLRLAAPGADWHTLRGMVLLNP